jgi:hypothetical protein
MPVPNPAPEQYGPQPTSCGPFATLTDAEADHLQAEWRAKHPNGGPTDLRIANALETIARRLDDIACVLAFIEKNTQPTPVFSEAPPA